jgi:urease accessory protein
MCAPNARLDWVVLLSANPMPRKPIPKVASFRCATCGNRCVVRRLPTVCSKTARIKCGRTKMAHANGADVEERALRRMLCCMHGALDLSSMHFSGSPEAPQRWLAQLDLRCEQVDGRSVLTRRSHVGPLRLLKPLYPEGEHLCHAVIVHPPGGIVAGDELNMTVAVERGAHLTVTTPGAQKWYRSAGDRARATTSLAVESTSVLEWIPQETIVFDGAQVEQSYRVDLTRESRFFGWDIVCFGRTWSDERFESGFFRQHIALARDGETVWTEHIAMRGGDPLLSSPLGFGGSAVIASAWIAFPSSIDGAALLDDVRNLLASSANAAASIPVEGLIVVKAVGDSAESVRHLLTDVWCKIRLQVSAQPPYIPRIWNT